MQNSEETRSLLSKSCDDIYNTSNENLNNKNQNESSFSRFHRYPLSGLPFHTNAYNLIPKKQNKSILKGSSSCFSLIDYCDELYSSSILSQDELIIPINDENDSPLNNDRTLKNYKLYISETKILVKYSIPIIISEVLRNSLLIMPVIFIGHRSPFELAAVTLG